MLGLKLNHVSKRGHWSHKVSNRNDSRFILCTQTCWCPFIGNYDRALNHHLGNLLLACSRTLTCLMFALLDSKEAIHLCLLIWCHEIDIFGITGHLWGESTSHQWIPSQGPVMHHEALTFWMTKKLHLYFNILDKLIHLNYPTYHDSICLRKWW